MSNKTIILGAGITGLSAGIDTGWDIYEAAGEPGGTARSYEYAVKAHDGQRYCFEHAGGHWIFFRDAFVRSFVQELSALNCYRRRARVFLSERGTLVPYPLQHHLQFLPAQEQAIIAREMAEPFSGEVRTQADWFFHQFGSRLCDLFFFPFHQRYTANLYPKLAPAETSRSPGLPALGNGSGTESSGYNEVFFYPQLGLRQLIAAMAARCRVQYHKRVVKIDVSRRRIFFHDGTATAYDRVISSVPLSEMMQLTGAARELGPADPSTSLLVVNIGAKRGRHCPDAHWIYTPHTRSRFYRVGFYSNVDAWFLPGSADKRRVSLYVEKAYPAGTVLSPAAVTADCREIIAELKQWGYIASVEVLSPQWVECAYAWRCAGSSWKPQALALLAKQGITQIGRYGGWNG